MPFPAEKAAGRNLCSRIQIKFFYALTVMAQSLCIVMLLDSMCKMSERSCQSNISPTNSFPSLEVACQWVDGMRRFSCALKCASHQCFIDA